MPLKNLAHRGMGVTQHLDIVPADQEIENTMPSYEAAIDAGADGMELDVWLTKDKKIIVNHGESSFERDLQAKGLASRGGLENYTAQELQSFDLGHGQHMPFFDEVLLMLDRRNVSYKQKTGDNLTLYVELKNADVVEPTYRMIQEFIENSEFTKKDFIFGSFDWENLQALHALDEHANILASCNTVGLFNPDDIVLPLYDVKPEASYQPDKFARLTNAIDEMKAYAFDLFLQDVKPELVDYAEQKQLSLVVANSARRKNADRNDLIVLQVLEYARRLPNVYLLTDDIRGVKEELKKQQDYRF